mgnify:CR=1 FL=1
MTSTELIFRIFEESGDKKAKKLYLILYLVKKHQKEVDAILDDMNKNLVEQILKMK